MRMLVGRRSRLGAMPDSLSAESEWSRPVLPDRVAKERMVEVMGKKCRRMDAK